MFGKYNLNNLTMIQNAKPSMLLRNLNNKINIAIYIQLEDKYQCIASISLEKENNNNYKNSGFSGAYYGFGELLYTMAFVELDKQNKTLIPDDRGLSEYAVKFYQKLDNSVNVISKLINGIKSYQKQINKDDLNIYNTLVQNHKDNYLSEKDINNILDQAYDLGEFMLPENNYIDRNKLFKIFSKKHLIS